MNVVSLLLVGMNAPARAMAVEASWLAFPAATVVDVPSIDEAIARAPALGPELLLIGDPDRAALERAIDATDRSGLRRWAVVVVGSAPSGDAAPAMVLTAEEEKPRLAARLFQSAVRLHALSRENARLHGDLSTMGRRISHDLRTPLTAIYTACEAINETEAESAAELAAFTRSITTSADELVQLLGRVSFVLKASAEPSPKAPVAMDEVVADALAHFERRILQKNATVHRAKTWPKASGVAAWLEVIWRDLVANALQHAGPAPRIELGWSETRGHFHFWVDDNGRGVPAEKTAKLFHPFNRLHELNAPRGLGLSVVQRLVELQGGSCAYEPRAGQGARFSFTLPAADAL